MEKVAFRDATLLKNKIKRLPLCLSMAAYSVQNRTRRRSLAHPPHSAPCALWCFWKLNFSMTRHVRKSVIIS